MEALDQSHKIKAIRRDIARVKTEPKCKSKGS
ncbi:50S ribosomal protein L29 [Mycoplasmopsis bovis]|nr:50S ribosomal protein L29 [Mycoplasmopsis bovis]